MIRVAADRQQQTGNRSSGQPAEGLSYDAWQAVLAQLVVRAFGVLGKDQRVEAVAMQFPDHPGSAAGIPARRLGDL